MMTHPYRDAESDTPKADTGCGHACIPCRTRRALRRASVALPRSRWAIAFMLLNAVAVLAAGGLAYKAQRAFSAATALDQRTQSRLDRLEHLDRIERADRMSAINAANAINSAKLASAARAASARMQPPPVPRLAPPTFWQRPPLSYDPSPRLPVREPLVAGIVQIGPSEFDVKRAAVDRILEGHSQSVETRRMSLTTHGGKVSGFALHGVRPGTLLGALGFEEGDCIEEINGINITTDPNKTLEAYSHLRTASEVTVKVLRRGERLRIRYHIR